MTNALDRHFSRIGARLMFGDPTKPWLAPCPVVECDEEGEFFLLDLDKARQGKYSVREVSRRHKALILTEHLEKGVIERLCRLNRGRWCIENIAAADTIDAVLRSPKRQRRKLSVATRSLTLLPQPNFEPPAEVLERTEPSGGRCSKRGFVAQYECRVPREAVYVCGQHPHGVSEAEWLDLRQRDPKAHRRQGWHRVVPSPVVYVRGWLWREEVPVVVLRMWYEVRGTAQA